MGLITLSGMEFFAYHGCMEEEAKKGGKFVVDLEFFTSTEHAENHDDLSKTIDYQDVYHIVKEEMEIRSKLIEHVAKRITDALYKKLEGLGAVKLTLSKINPPLGGKVDRVSITLTRKM